MFIFKIGKNGWGCDIYVGLSLSLSLSLEIYSWTILRYAAILWAANKEKKKKTSKNYLIIHDTVCCSKKNSRFFLEIHFETKLHKISAHCTDLKANCWKNPVGIFPMKLKVIFKSKLLQVQWKRRTENKK